MTRGRKDGGKEGTEGKEGEGRLKRKEKGECVKEGRKERGNKERKMKVRKGMGEVKKGRKGKEEETGNE